MKCEDARLNLNAAVDRELNRRDRLALRAHLLRCAACRSELASLRALSQQLAAMPAPEAFAQVHETATAAAHAAVPSSARPARPRRWALVVGGGVLVIGAALFLMLRPTPAQAALQRVIAAAEAVKTCHMVMWFQYPGEERSTKDFWYAEGKLRIETSQGEIQLFDGQSLHIYQPESNAVFRNVSDQPFGTPFGGFTVAGIVKMGGNPEISVERVEQEGRTLNRFTVTQLQEERMVILADPETDLPISIEMYGKLAQGWEKLAGVDQIEYNVPLDPDLFVLTPPEGAQVIDQAELGEQWQARYDQGLGRAELDGHDIVLRDFQVMTGGDVRVIWSGMSQSEVWGWPLVDGTTASTVETQLADNEGNTYLGEVWHGPAKDVGSWFVPLEPLPSRERTYTLRITTQRPENGRPVVTDSASFAVARPWYSPLPDPVYPPVSDMRGPDNFIFPRGSGGEIDRADMRAEYWREHGDVRQALRYYEEEIRAMDQQEPGGRLAWDTPHWLIVGQLYEQVGDVEKAREAYRRGLECEKGEDYDPGHRAANAIKAALRRLE